MKTQIRNNTKLSVMRCGISLMKGGYRPIINPIHLACLLLRKGSMALYK
jgi:hypothetical protein